MLLKFLKLKYLHFALWDNIKECLEGDLGFYSD